MQQNDATLPAGRYRHYKGNEYSVLGVARHSETLEEVVIYRQEYGERGWWVRPKSMFVETVSVSGQEMPRFRYLGPEQKSHTAKANVFHDLPQHLPDELIQTIVSAANVRIERIVSHGQASPQGFWYDQDEHEWVLVLQGAARLLCEGEAEVELKPGDYVSIPAHKRHRVEWTSAAEPTVWLAVHYEG